MGPSFPLGRTKKPVSESRNFQNWFALQGGSYHYPFTHLTLKIAPGPQARTAFRSGKGNLVVPHQDFVKEGTWVGSRAHRGGHLKTFVPPTSNAL